MRIVVRSWSVVLALSLAACSTPPMTGDSDVDSGPIADGADAPARSDAADAPADHDATPPLDAPHDTAVDSPMATDTRDAPDVADATDVRDSGTVVDATDTADIAPMSDTIDDTADVTDATSSDVADVMDDDTAVADVPIDTPCALTVCGSACVDTSTDPHNCGTCGNDCTALANVTSAATCAAGQCVIAGACASGYADCDADPTNGCETSLTTATNCGACGVACTDPTPMCAPGASGASCVSGCGGATSAHCGTSCVDTNTDPANCGGCGNGCSAPANASATCTSGTCGFACNAGYHACGAVCLSDDSTSMCGAACVTCPVPTNGSAACISGTCGITCDTGYHPCGNVCAADDSSSMCGASCVSCPYSQNSYPTCTSGMCGIACQFGWGDCDMNAANGCETSLMNASNCGSCGNACPGDPNGTANCAYASSGWTCSLTCNTGYVMVGAQCVLAPPRPIAPLSTSTVTSHAPTFHWANALGATGAQVEIFRDRACTMSVASVAATGTSVIAPATVSAGVYYWRLQSTVSGQTLTSPVWEFWVGARSAPVDTSFGTTVDVNGDGHADVIMVNRGSVYVFEGSATGVSGPATTTFVVPPGLSYTLPSIASAGDVNGDGYGDVIVGLNDAWIYLGGPSGLATAPATHLSVSNNGWAFGQSVASAGDVNGDGYADVVVGAPLAAPYSGEPSFVPGRAYVFLGGASGVDTTPSATITGDGFQSALGAAVAGAGDVNGDGFGDVLIGEPEPPMSSFVAGGFGNALIYLGSASGLVTATPITLTGMVANNDPNGYFGSSVASAGDVNGDGYADVVIGAYGANSNAGAAYVYLGAASGPANTAATTLTAGSVANSFFGTSVSGAGDVDGDGFGDVVIAGSVPGMFSTVTPMLYAYAGASGGLATSPFASLAGPLGAQGNNLMLVAGAGDIDGDNHADVLFGLETGTLVFMGTATNFGSTSSTLSGGPYVARIAPSFRNDRASDLVCARSETKWRWVL